jgi:hypothetical protein
MSSCKLTIGQLYARANMKLWTGPATTGIGSGYNFGFAVSDVVPANLYWAILAANIFVDGAPGTDPANMCASLHLCLPGASLPQNAIGPNGGAVAYKQWPIFLSHNLGRSNPVLICNGGPVDPSQAIRIDDLVSQDTAVPAGFTTPIVFNMIRGRRPLILPSQCALLASNWNSVGIGGGIQAIVSLNLLYAQCKVTETIEGW